MITISESKKVLEQLEDWYLGECNGDWEHTYGIKIDTLDNPGWIVIIDLHETKWESLNIPREFYERSEIDWIQIEVKNHQFIGSGGIKILNEILDSFLNLVNTN